MSRFFLRRPGLASVDPQRESPPLRWGGAGRSNVGQGESEGPQDRIKDNCLAAKKREKKVE